MRARWQQAQLVQASIALALILASSVVCAQPSPRAGLGLNWVRLGGAASCIASVDLMNRIEQEIGRIIFVRTGEAVLTLDGYVQPSPSTSEVPAGWLVTFEISDARGKVLGRRELDRLEGSDCEVVTSAAILVIELTLDPDGLLGAGIPLEPPTQALLDELLRGEPSELDPSTLPKGKQAAARRQPDQASDAGSAALESRATTPTPSRVALDVAGVGMLGSMPALAAGAAVNVAVELRQGWSVELNVLALARQEVRAPRYDHGAATFGYQTLSGALCRSVMWIDLCGGAEYGFQSVSARGFKSPRGPQTLEILNARAQVTLRLDLFGGLFLRASMAAILPLLRHDYVYDTRRGDLRLLRTEPVLGKAEVGLGLYI